MFVFYDQELEGIAVYYLQCSKTFLLWPFHFFSPPESHSATWHLKILRTTLISTILLRKMSHPSPPSALPILFPFSFTVWHFCWECQVMPLSSGLWALSGINLFPHSGSWIWPLQISFLFSSCPSILHMWQWASTGLSGSGCAKWTHSLHYLICLPVFSSWHSSALTATSALSTQSFPTSTGLWGTPSFWVGSFGCQLQLLVALPYTLETQLQFSTMSPFATTTSMCTTENLFCWHITFSFGWGLHLVTSFL